MRARGVTWVELLTAAVALVVIVAVAIPLWRTHQLRARRESVMRALRQIQVAQDRHFGQHARYAAADDADIAPAVSPALTSASADYRIDIELGADRLSYRATARAIRTGRDPFDTRCATLSIDQHGRTFATNESGDDSTADCWGRQ